MPISMNEYAHNQRWRRASVNMPEAHVVQITLRSTPGDKIKVAPKARPEERVVLQERSNGSVQSRSQDEIRAFRRRLDAVKRPFNS